MRTKLLIGIALFSILLVSAASAACPDGMISYWRGEGNANDEKGLNPGTEQGGIVYTTGKVGQTFSFDGVNDYINLGNSKTLEPAQVTVEAWVKLNSPISPGQARSIFDNGYAYTNNNNFGYYLVAANNIPNNQEFTGKYGAVFGTHCGSCGGWIFATGSTNPSDNLAAGTWYYLVASYNSSSFKLYVNGALKSQRDGVTQLYYNDPLVQKTLGGRRILGYSQVWDVFPGLIDEVAIYNRALTEVEIENHYNNGNGKDYCSAGAPADTDEDGVPDAEDNCVNEYNPDQANADGDATGDVCDVCPSDANNLCLQGYTDGANAAPTETTTLQSVEVQVIIPPGAVAEDTSVSMQRGSVGDFEICTSTTTCFTAYNQTKYSFEPEITFLQPIELKFSYAGAPAATYNKCLNEGCDIFWMNESSNKWVPQKANCSAEPGWCVLFTDHFSEYVLGVLEYDYVGEATITLTATDDNSGVANIYYCIDSADVCTPNLVYSSPLYINTVGTSYVRYYAVDNAGNSGETYSKIISIVAFCDREAPALEIILSGILSGDTYVSSVNWLIRATDALSGMKSLEYNLTQI